MSGTVFRIAQPAPRRIYKEEEYEKSLLELHLTPASSLLVLIVSILVLIVPSTVEVSL